MVKTTLYRAVSCLSVVKYNWHSVLVTHFVHPFSNLDSKVVVLWVFVMESGIISLKEQF